MVNKKKLVLSLIVIVLSFIISKQFVDSSQQSSSQPPLQPPAADQRSDASAKVADAAQNSDQIMAQAFAKQLNDVAVEGSGSVKAVLKDDEHGARHQKFILQLASGQTVLVAHNIDLAKRVEGLKKGDRVDFKGDYEYSAQGGVIHWTHKDPSHKHLDGWLEHQGKRYQ